jgi:hypothetical protein
MIDISSRSWSSAFLPASWSSHLMLFHPNLNYKLRTRIFVRTGKPPVFLRVLVVKSRQTEQIGNLCIGVRHNELFARHFLTCERVGVGR